MAKTNLRSVDDYIASQPEATQAVLKRVRGIIRKALPAAEEVISYQIPTYKLRGQAVVYFAGWKQHYSLYPTSAALVKAFKPRSRLTNSARARSASRSARRCRRS